MGGIFGVNSKTNLGGIIILCIAGFLIVKAGTLSVEASGLIVTGASLLGAKDRDVTGGTRVQSSEGATEVVK